ncbi:MAG: ACT domain-containing protein [Proteobacteria bacterium]|nr:ACT domain-containing protein [Pseudomonadota bacterium]
MKKETQFSVILTNAPGELSKLCDVLKEANINILAMSIQNAKDSVKELYNMKIKTNSRIEMKESYLGILKESSNYSLIRLLVDDSKEGEKVLAKAKYLLDKDHVLVLKLGNKPGMLGKMAKIIGDAHVNIDYVYGSAMKESQEAIFIVHIAEADIDKLKDSLKDF